MLYSIVGEEFRTFTHDMIEARNIKAVVDNQLQIDMDPQIFECFQNSTFQSSKSAGYVAMLFHLLTPCDHFLVGSKGRAAFMLKAGYKRRRRDVDVGDQDSQLDITDLQMAQQKERIVELESLLESERLQIHSNQMASEILRRFIEDGDAV